ncbi:MAG: Stk1 family PASTA domain-containing Ser/Thr kinase [Pseudonocardiaceae bacterium]
MSITNLLSNRYELGDTLGYGGMSEVHHGHDVRLGREVAVKILRADLARDPVFQERFRREAQNAAALNHPAIVAVYDTGETQTEYGPLPYIVMEYVEGRTLRDIVKTEGPMPQKRAMEVMADVCAALDFSHRHGIIHRDVKPANVMITKTGAVKVMDFGIARAIHDGQSAMTQTAAVIGTAQYLSPEQARGESVDARSDVYAAGCVLYELISGEPPFTGDSPVAVAYQHVREDPLPPSAVNPAVSPALDAVVLKALTKGPANRYQSSAEMRSDLVRVLSDQRPAAPMVMTEDDRTQVMADGGRHADGYDDYDEEAAALDRRKRRNRMLVLLAVLGVIVVAFVMWLTGAFDSAEATAQVPNVVGQPIDRAEQALRAQGFSDLNKTAVPCYPEALGAEPPCDPVDDVGKVIEVTPKAGTKVDVATEITVFYGVPPQSFDMPNLVDEKRAEAEKIIAQKNLLLDPNVEEVENSDPKKTGAVASQDPKAGERVEEGQKVTIEVYAKPVMVEVTDYTGRSFDTAQAGLSGAGFEVVRQDVDSDRPAGEVVGQKPNGGEAVKGSKVVVEVSNGADEPMTVPSLVGKTEAEAREALRSAGHTGEITIEQEPVSNPDQNGRVTKSDPSSGSTIKKSDRVTLFLGEFSGDPGDGGGDGEPPPCDDDDIFPPDCRPDGG